MWQKPRISDGSAWDSSVVLCGCPAATQRRTRHCVEGPLQTRVELEHRGLRVVLCLVPLPMLVGLVAKRQQTQRDRRQHAFWMRLWSGYTEVLHGMGTVRAFAQERLE